MKTKYTQIVVLCCIFFSAALYGGDDSSGSNEKSPQSRHLATIFGDIKDNLDGDKTVIKVTGATVTELAKLYAKAYGNEVIKDKDGNVVTIYKNEYVNFTREDVVNFASEVGVDVVAHVVKNIRNTERDSNFDGIGRNIALNVEAEATVVGGLWALRRLAKATGTEGIDPLKDKCPDWMKFWFERVIRRSAKKVAGYVWANSPLHAEKSGGD